jgi:REP element-mobilizing transposase RayT
MTNNQKITLAINNRRSIRLQNYDYTEAGAYFITICAHNQKCTFGVGADSKPAQSPDFKSTHTSNPLSINKYGEIVRDTWEDLVNHNAGIELDAFVIMPNHVHGIIVIDGMTPCPLSEIVRQLKTFSARRINKMRGTPGIQVWQRNYYEHVIRGEEDLNILREYIDNNPASWRKSSPAPHMRTIKPPCIGQL